MATLMGSQNAILDVMVRSATDGLAVAGAGTPAVRRLTEMRDFYAHMRRELPALIARWREGSRSGG
ncbi:hypothetical protein ABZY90_32260 [Streptomyces sp. NPDC006422]|uniref:hypothetical protein n=1 Tax=unclassified Streptomyces TaxID=2593676 RepID=UPI0033B06231